MVVNRARRECEGTPMRHDYDLPSDWHTYTPEEKCRWYTLERNRRQALRQKEAGAMPYLEMLESKVFDRMTRKAEARSGTVDVSDYR